DILHQRWQAAAGSPGGGGRQQQGNETAERNGGKSAPEMCPGHGILPEKLSRPRIYKMNPVRTMMHGGNSSAGAPLCAVAPRAFPGRAALALLHPWLTNAVLDSHQLMSQKHKPINND